LIVGMVALPSIARAQKSPTAQAALAHAYEDLAANKLAEAAAQLEIAVRFEPGFALGWYLLGSVSRRAGDPDRAAAGYRRYIELRPAEPDAYFGLGVCLDAVGDHAGAIAALKHYAESDPRASSAPFVAEARTRIATLERSGGSKVAPAAADRNARAAALLAARKFVEAAELLRASIAIAPADAAAWYKLGFALRQAGQPADAAKAYRRSITLQPADFEAYYGLGQVLVAANRPDEALAAFRTYVKAGPEKTDARWIAKARKEIARLQAARAPSHSGAAPVAGQPSTRSGAASASLATAPAARPAEPAPAGGSAAPAQRPPPVETRE
jgi:tetratricopeptide (TPR) repeat protein